LFQDSLIVGIFIVDLREFRELCKDRIEKGTKQLCRLLILKISKECNRLELSFNQLINVLEKPPENIEELAQLRRFCFVEMDEELEKLRRSIGDIIERMDLLSAAFYKISYEDFSKAWSIFGMPLELQTRQKEAQGSLKVFESRFVEVLTQSQLRLAEEI